MRATCVSASSPLAGAVVQAFVSDRAGDRGTGDLAFGPLVIVVVFQQHQPRARRPWNAGAERTKAWVAICC
jgi:hypothetical protein